MGNRSRTRGQLAVPVGTAWTYKSWPVSCANRTETALLSFPHTYSIGRKQTTVDVTTPKFWERSKAGEFILSPFHSVIHDVSVSGGGTVTFTNKTTTCTPPLTSWFQVSGKFFVEGYLVGRVGSEFYPNALIPHDRVGTLFDQVWTKCLAGRQQGVANYVESLAELDKAFAMFGTPLENVSAYHAAFSREREKKRKALLKKFRPRGSAQRRNRMLKLRAKALSQLFASEWLRYRYGIKPLIADVQAGLAALKKVYDQKPVRYASRASTSVFDSKNNPLVYTSATETLNYWRNDTHSVKVRAVFTDEYVYSPFNEVGVLFNNLLTVGWELTRLSFVFDWFVNLGDVLQANAPRVGIKPLGGTVTVRQERTSFWYASSLTHTVYNVSGPPSDTAKAAWNTVDRYVMSDSIGRLVIKDDFRLGNFTRAMDAITLIKQQIGSFKFFIK